jgi:hypothetical protein
MIDLYTIKMTPAMSHKYIMKNFDSGAGLEQTNQLTKVKQTWKSSGTMLTWKS